MTILLFDDNWLKFWIYLGPYIYLFRWSSDLNHSIKENDDEWKNDSYK